jgi:hypothetical protein
VREHKRGVWTVYSIYAFLGEVSFPSSGSLLVLKPNGAMKSLSNALDT